MNLAQKNALTRAIQTLTALQAEFHIVLPNGDTFGRPLTVATGRKGSRGPKNSGYVRKYISGMLPGEVVEIPPQDGDTLARLQSCLSAVAFHDWGKGAYTTATDTDRGVVSIFREA